MKAGWINLQAIKDEYQIGDKVAVKEEGKKRYFGTVAGKYDHLILIDNGSRKESYSYVDILIGAVDINVQNKKAA